MKDQDPSSSLDRPPEAYRAFVDRFPELGRAWDLLHEAEEKSGPLDAKTRRLIKLAASLGAGREGSVHASVRKAVAMGISREEIEQAVVVCASVLGMPGSVAAFSWVRDVLEE